MKYPVYSKEGKKTGEVSLPDTIFGLKWNSDLVYQVATSQAANRRQKTAHAKDRAQVRGGGRKPWKQKGTGRARHGSIRSPLWKGGGVTHGPLKEKSYKKKINKKMAKKALWTVLSRKARDHKIVVVDDLSFPEAKTKHAKELFHNFSAQKEFSRIEKGNGVLVLTPGKDGRTYRAIRNLPYARVEEVRQITAHDALSYSYILFPRQSIESIM